VTANANVPVKLLPEPVVPVGGHGSLLPVDDIIRAIGRETARIQAHFTSIIPELSSLHPILRPADASAGIAVAEDAAEIIAAAAARAIATEITATPGAGDIDAALAGATETRPRLRRQAAARAEAAAIAARVRGTLACVF
jgi:hypothetical protein